MEQPTQTFRYITPLHGGEGKKRPNRLMIASGVLLVLGLVFLALFWREQSAYRASDRLYSELRQEISQSSTESGQKSRIAFQTLQAQNPDTVAWLEIPGLDLALPVVRTSDNDYYLHHSFDGSANNNGCLFLAAQDSGDFSELYNIIFGHNIHNGAMFGSLQSYSDPEFFAQNPTFTLCTPQRDYTCRVFSCHAAQDGDEVYTAGWTAGAEYDAFLQELCSLAEYDTGVVPESGSRVLTLSTCASSYASNTKRFVVHAVLEPETD